MAVSFKDVIVYLGSRGTEEPHCDAGTLVQGNRAILTVTSVKHMTKLVSMRIFWRFSDNRESRILSSQTHYENRWYRYFLKLL